MVKRADKKKSPADLSDSEKVELGRWARIELARRAAKEKNVLEWGRWLFPDKFTKEFCKELHEYLVSIRNEPFTNTEAPRSHAKTTIRCFLIPLFQALEEPKRYRHYLNIQATDAKARSVNISIREELENNAELRTLYGDQVGKSKWTDQQFVLANGVIFTAAGAGQSIRGINYRNVRPGYILVDDLYDEDDINNPESTEKKNRWFWATLYPSRDLGVDTGLHVQGTAINKMDILNQLEGRAGWKSRSFKAIVDEGKRLALWPEAVSFDRLLKMREDMGTIIFNREMMNDRRDEKTSIIKPSWIKFYNPESLVFDRTHRIKRVLLCCDPSIGAKEENDYTGIALVIEACYSKSSGSVFYVERVWNQHLSLDARIRILEQIADGMPSGRKVQQVRVEAISGFKDFCHKLKKDTNLPVKEIGRVKDKITTMENKSHFFENGKVLINEKMPQDEKSNLVYQLTTNHPRNDDVRDAVLLALEESPDVGIFIFDND